MSFEWETEYDNETFRQLSGLIKKKDGVFASYKQASFLFGDNSPFQSRDDASSLKTHFNVDITSNEKAIQASAYVRWAAGARAFRPVTWFFVIDEKGVTKQYKLKYKGDTKSGTAPDPTKTELLWSRPEGLDFSHLTPPPKEDIDPGKHLGEVKERLVWDLTVIKIIERGTDQFGRTGWLTVMEDQDHNTVFYNGNFRTVITGDNIVFKATVKKHIESKDGKNVTVIDRPHVPKGLSNPTVIKAWKQMESGEISEKQFESIKKISK